MNMEAYKRGSKKTNQMSYVCEEGNKQAKSDLCVALSWLSWAFTASLIFIDLFVFYVRQK